MESLKDAAQRYRRNLTDAALAIAAQKLGVSQRSLRELGCGLATDAEMRARFVGFGEGEYPTQALTFPERDALGTVVGITYRAWDGRKGAALGSKRALVYSEKPPETAPVLFAEGPTDTAAGTTLFVYTVGRASCAGGEDLIAALPGVLDRAPLILADSDGPGLEGAKKLAQELANRWKRPVSWTTPPEGHKDLRAYVQALGLDVEDPERCAAAGERLIEELRARAKVVQPLGLTTCIADIEKKPLKWLLPPCIPQGKLAILAGHPGLGKSLVSIDFAARLSRGEGMQGERGPEGPVDVLLLSAEDDPADTVRPRLEAAGAVLERIHVSRCLDINDLVKMLDERPNVRFVVLDPLSAYVGQIDTHKDAQVRTMLAPFVELASDRGVTILFVAHLKKSEEGDAILRPGGSIAFVAAARIGWIVLKDPKDPQRRYCLPLKNNLGPDAYGFAYRVAAEGPDAPPRIAWESERVTETADAILAKSRPKVERAGRGESLEEAAEFLREFLADGAKPVVELWETAKANGIGKPSLKRAKKKLGIIARKMGMADGWEWTLPPDESKPGPEPEGAQPPPTGGSEPLREDPNASAPDEPPMQEGAA